ncbi:MAG: DUF6596 domain-containing protein, partial [Natronospirillum sp.]
AWLVSTGRFKAIDRIRKRVRHDANLNEIAADLEADVFTPEDSQVIEDDQLRLIFTCCHPSLSPEARLALTLREVCRLRTEQIAAAFLIPASTLAQRIVRAKSKIRNAGIPYEVPEADQLSQRLQSVLQVIYLVFNEGYSASAGDSVDRRELCAEAIRLGKLLETLLPEAEVLGLLSLMLLHDARRAARTSATGELIPLEEQDRSLWDAQQIRDGCERVEKALKSPHAGAYALQAAISAVHAEAASAENTDWRQIVGLYEVLIRVQPSPVVELNYAVAIAMLKGPQYGLAPINAILQRGDLNQYHLAYAARADLHRRLHQSDEAISNYRRAIELAEQAPERRFLQRRLAELESPQ